MRLLGSLKLYTLLILAAHNLSDPKPRGYPRVLGNIRYLYLYSLSLQRKRKKKKRELDGKRNPRGGGLLRRPRGVPLTSAATKSNNKSIYSVRGVKKPEVDYNALCARHLAKGLKMYRASDSFKIRKRIKRSGGDVVGEMSLFLSLQRFRLVFETSRPRSERTDYTQDDPLFMLAPFFGRNS